jgi:hypothetical protein
MAKLDTQFTRLPYYMPRIAKTRLGLHRAFRPPQRMFAMAKSQKKSSKEVRKPKADKGPKQNASQPSQKTGVVRGLDNMKK